MIDDGDRVLVVVVLKRRTRKLENVTDNSPTGRYLLGPFL